MIRQRSSNHEPGERVRGMNLRADQQLRLAAWSEKIVAMDEFHLL